ncbi:BTAD domain-containing putative transcriptional regulator [Nonomuraea sp. NPDC049419]|uniref:AfsR/SARP family transcriptional regulator n=1 Tax=Nonomuraea sp. NPDC049419 TaxID=3155772 RepID=UPI00343E0C81
MDFTILGPVRVLDEGRPIRLAARARAVLGVFLLHPGTVLSRDRLIASVWDDPPRSAVPNLQQYVTALRRAGIGVESAPYGYLLRLEPDRLDLLTFDEAAHRARLEAARGDLAAAHRLFGRALALWRGRPAEDVPLAATVQARIAELEERRENARLAWIDVRLRLGLHDELVGELAPLVDSAPLNERLWHRLMLALHRAGRRAEALEAYRRARSTLVAELGIEPGHDLRTLHTALLNDADPMPSSTVRAVGEVGELGGAAGRREGVSSAVGHVLGEDGGVVRSRDAGVSLSREPAWAGVCLLPADIAEFVGRERESAELVAALKGGGGAPPIVTVSGQPGVGKSTLAVHVAHRLRERYPDGQLFVRLAGASAAPRDASDLLAELLRVLGVDFAALPTGVEERAAVYRARLADRAVLVLLDDAAAEDQVQPLIPGTPRSAVLVTSRGPLPALPGATSYALDVPPLADARDLLAGVAGAERMAGDPEAAEAIVRSCGRLPLALRIAGARLATRPAWPPAELARRLRTASPLNELRSGPLDVRATFEASYAALSEPARRAFRLLGSVPADGVAAWTVAALAGVSAHDVDASLEELAAAGLITAGDADAAASPRYRMHDLLRGFAGELFATEESARSRTAALRRATAEACARTTEAARELPPAFAPPPPGLPARTPPCPEGGAWLAAERAVLVALAVAAARAGLVREAALLAQALAPFLIVRGFHDDAVRLLGMVAEAAAEAGDTATEIRMRLIRGDAEVDRRRAGAVAEEFRLLLARGSETGDRHAAAYALLGIAATLESDLGSALAAATMAAERFETLGDEHGLLAAWTEIAGIQFYLSRYDAAAATLRRALAMAEGHSAVHSAVHRAVHSAVHRARFLRSLGIACYETGRADEAIGHYRAAIDLSRELRWSYGERVALRRLAQAEAALGHYDTAVARLARCAEMFEDAGDTQGQAMVAYTLGEISRRRGDERAALEHFTACLDRLDPLNEPVWTARARDQVARSRAALG